MTVWRTALACALVLAVACGRPPVPAAPEPPEPSPAPTASAVVAGTQVPPGPVLFRPEELIFPPEEMPLHVQVALDAPLEGRGWERQFVPGGSPDFRWFTVRLFVLEPDVPSTSFIADHGCDAVSWPDERPSAQELAALPSGDGARACRYEFSDGLRVLYHTTGYRNVGVVVGAQPRRAEVSDELALEWLAALARQQIAIIGRVLIAHPPPVFPEPEVPEPTDAADAVPSGGRSGG